MNPKVGSRRGLAVERMESRWALAVDLLTTHLELEVPFDLNHSTMEYQETSPPLEQDSSQPEKSAEEITDSDIPLDPPYSDPPYSNVGADGPLVCESSNQGHHPLETVHPLQLGKEPNDSMEQPKGPDQPPRTSVQPFPPSTTVVGLPTPSISRAPVPSIAANIYKKPTVETSIYIPETSKYIALPSPIRQPSFNDPLSDPILSKKTEQPKESIYFTYQPTAKSERLAPQQDLIVNQRVGLAAKNFKALDREPTEPTPPGNAGLIRDSLEIEEPSTNSPLTLAPIGMISEGDASVPEPPSASPVPSRRSFYLSNGLRLIATTCLALLLLKANDKKWSEVG